MIYVIQKNCKTNKLTRLPERNYYKIWLRLLFDTMGLRKMPPHTGFCRSHSFSLEIHLHIWSPSFQWCSFLLLWMINNHHFTLCCFLGFFYFLSCFFCDDHLLPMTFLENLLSPPPLLQCWLPLIAHLIRFCCCGNSLSPFSSRFRERKSIPLVLN